MRAQEIKQVVGLLKGDVWVDVDIQFKPLIPTASTKENIILDKVNADMGALAFEIKQEIKKKINEYFS